MLMSRHGIGRHKHWPHNLQRRAGTYGGIRTSSFDAKRVMGPWAEELFSEFPQVQLPPNAQGPQQPRTISTVPLQRVPINNFRGGLNTRDGPFDLQPNESPDLMNVTLTSLVGQLQMRQGKTRFDSNSPANTIDYARQIVLGSTVRFLMCSVNGSIYSCDPGGNFVLRFIGTVGTVWTFEQMPDASGTD